MPTAAILYGGGITPIKIFNNSAEPYLFGVITIDSIEPFDLLRGNIAWSSIEPFDLMGNLRVNSIEPFDFGANIRVDSIEPFYLSDSTAAYIGTNSLASPRLGWGDDT